MALQQAAPRVFGLLGRAPVALGQSGILTGSSGFKNQGFNGEAAGRFMCCEQLFRGTITSCVLPDLPHLLGSRISQSHRLPAVCGEPCVCPGELRNAGRCREIAPR